MNYIKHLTAYFDRVVDDHSLNPTHISLYIALFQFWNLNRFQNPISITRDEVMRISKICSKATYHKCMRELHDKGYVIYEPSYNPFKGSMLQMINLSHELKPIKRSDKTNSKNRQVVEQEVNKQQTSSKTATEQALVSSINNINSTNNTNILNLDLIQKATKNKEFNNKLSENNCHSGSAHYYHSEPVEESHNQCPPELVEGSHHLEPAHCHSEPVEESHYPESVHFHPDSVEESHNQCHPEPVEESHSVCHPELVEGITIPPNQESVKQFFKTESAPEVEAEKFYNHYKSNGWMIGGKSKMKDWKASARNWLLNSQKFNSKATRHPELVVGPKSNHLQVLIQKNYGEPL